MNRKIGTIYHILLYNPNRVYGAYTLLIGSFGPMPGGCQAWLPRRAAEFMIYIFTPKSPNTVQALLQISLVKRLITGSES